MTAGARDAAAPGDPASNPEAPRDGTAGAEAAVRDAKRAMRRAMRARVEAIAPWHRARAERRAAHLACLAPPLAHARTVLAYRALPDEIGVSPLVAGLVARGVRVAFPHVDGRGRLLLLLPPAEAAVPGPASSVAACWTRDRFGIAALLPDAPGVVRLVPRDLDAVIVPGRAFDLAGARLGRGKGFYDALLARLRPDARAATVGVAFAAQVVGEVPREPHDRRVAWIATERGTRRATR